MSSAHHITDLPLAELNPSQSNARTHSKRQIRQIADSIEVFGFNNPILIDANGTIIAGNGRYEAAKLLGLDIVPTVQLSHLTPAQVRAYIITDNRLAELAGWDREILAIELQNLEIDADFDVTITGFDIEDIKVLLDETGIGEGEPDDDPPPPNNAAAVTGIGDLWDMGNHRLLCGDATAADDVGRVLAGGHAGMCFCDPPYNVEYVGSPNRGRQTRRSIANDDLGAEFPQFLQAACINILNVTEGAIYVCMSSSEIHTLRKAFEEAGGHWSTFLIWAKNTFTLGRSDYQRQFEPILYGWREGSAHYWCGDRDQGDVWFIDKPTRNDHHSTQKPLELVKRAIRNSSKSGDVVLDPFGGSGSTLMACEATRRRARLVELDPLNVDVTIRRWQSYTGRDAVHCELGTTFTELAAKRAAPKPKEKGDVNKEH